MVLEDLKLTWLGGVVLSVASTVTDVAVDSDLERSQLEISKELIQTSTLTTGSLLPSACSLASLNHWGALLWYQGQ